MSNRNGHSSELPADAQVHLRPGLTAADLGDEAVVLDAKSGKYFGLNEVAARIFNACRNPRTVGEIIDELEGEYDVEPERLRKDVAAFLEDLRNRGLVIINHA